MAMLFKGGLPVSKTPEIVSVIGAVVLAASVGSAAANPRPDVPARSLDQSVEPVFNALDGRRLDETASAPFGPAGDSATGALAWSPWPGAANRPALDLDSFDSVTRPSADANAKPPPGRFGLRQFIDRFRYGGLPVPASWALILIGFAMIGGAFRGFVVANRRLARLQPDE
jgi:hypothetical protein